MFYTFNDEPHFYQNFVKENISLLGKILIVKEQLNINNKFFIDILALDRTNNKIIIIELKNAGKKFKIIDQIITYYDLIIKSNIEELLDEFIEKNNLNISTLDVDLTPSIFVVTPDFNEQMLQNFNYINIPNIKLIKMNLIQNDNSFEVVKEEYNPKDIIADNKVKTEIEKEYTINDYTVNIEAKRLLQSLLNYLNYVYKCSNFFYKDKITVYLDKNWLMQINVSQNKVYLTFKEKQIIKNNLLYNHEITSYKLLKDKIKIEINKIPVETIRSLIND
jgi:hypothetical protein